MRWITLILLLTPFTLPATHLPLTPTDSLIFDHTFNLRFEQALHIAKREQSLKPDIPKYFFMEAAIHFSQRAYVSATGPYATRHARRDSLMDLILEITEPAIDKFEDREWDDEQKMFLAGLYGYQGRVYAEREEWWNTFTNGLKGRRLLNALYEEDPENYDALLGLGIFNYYSDRLSGVIGFVARALGFSGNREEGIRMLKLCFENAELTKSEAAITLIDIYDTFENNERDARPYFEWVIGTYPQNWLVKDWYLNRMMNIGRFDLIRPYFNDPGETILEVTRGRYAYELCRFDSACVHYGRALEKPQLLSPFQRQWSAYNMRIMRILDGNCIADNTSALLPWMERDLAHFEKNRDKLAAFMRFKCRLNKGAFPDIPDSYVTHPPFTAGDPFFDGWFSYIMSSYYTNAQNWDKAEHYAWKAIKELSAVFGGGSAKNLIYIYKQTRPGQKKYQRLKKFIDKQGYEKLAFQLRDIAPGK